MTALTTCSQCGAPVSREARACPQCGHPLPLHWGQMGTVGILLVIAVIVILAAVQECHFAASIH